MRKPSSSRNRSTVLGRTLVWCLFASMLLCGCSAQQQHQQQQQQQEMEAHWTPNDTDDGGGPLPLSQAQRQELLRLEQAIVSSPDPQATLAQVAQANDMEPQELVNVLQRNRQDLAGRQRIIYGWPQRTARLVASAAVAVFHVVQRHPQRATLLAVTLLILMHVVMEAPRTGLVLSTTRRGPLSKGPTTFWRPPSTYVAGLLLEHSNDLSSSSKPSTVLVPHGDDDDDDEHDVVLPKFRNDNNVHWHKLSSHSQALVVQRNIDVTDFVATSTTDEEQDAEEEEEEEHDANDDELSFLQDLVYRAAVQVVSSQFLTEFAPDDESVRFQGRHILEQQQDDDDDDDEIKDHSDVAMLVVRGMGDWGRYGLQPLFRILQTDLDHEETTNNNSNTTTYRCSYATLPGGHFDGQLEIFVRKRPRQQQQQSQQVYLQVRLRLLNPKRRRRPSRRVAETIVTALADSIAKSTRIQTQQTLHRQRLGRDYRGSVSRHARTRRQMKLEEERKHEEMARDRRRKWQRRHPDAGRYRPSGDRMKSPRFFVS